MERIKKNFFARNWWKILCVLLLVYTIIGGLLVKVPDLPVIHQSIRAIFFHVGMWFSMIVLMLISATGSVLYLRSNNLRYDTLANEAVNTGIFFGILGILTGSVWARYTWGVWWLNDPKLNGAAVSLLAYFAYRVLRSSLTDAQKKARLAAVYNIFAFVLMIVFMMILPRTAADSIHPGKSGNPALTPGELDSNLRLVFYPAMIGWIMLGIWILNFRIKRKSIIKH
ncbi:MAG: cytochrome c biogenesis protein CcsA [Bacteroidota bacterium]